jgi:hypothetical protein
LDTTKSARLLFVFPSFSHKNQPYVICFWICAWRSSVLSFAITYAIPQTSEGHHACYIFWTWWVWYKFVVLLSPVDIPTNSSVNVINFQKPTYISYVWNISNTHNTENSNLLNDP